MACRLGASGTYDGRNIVKNKKNICLMLGATIFPWTLFVAPCCAAEIWPKFPVHISAEAITTQGIETATSFSGSITAHIDVQAYVEADQRKTARIVPVGSGRITDIFVSPGQFVKEGTALFSYNNYSLSDEKERYLSSKAALQQAQAMERDAAEAERRGRILQGGAISKGEEKRRKALLADASALVQQRLAVVKNQEEHMRRFSSSTEKVEGLSSVVVSPVNGVVRSINVALGGSVGNNGLPPVEVVNLRSVWVVSQIPQTAISSIKIGSNQETIIPKQRKSKFSHVDFIEETVDPGTRRVQVRSLVDNTDTSLRPGMLVRARIFSQNAVSGQIVPTDSLQTIADQPCIFVKIGPDKYLAKHVVTGPSFDERVVVTEGLLPGDIVVGKGSFILKSQALLVPASLENKNKK